MNHQIIIMIYNSMNEWAYHLYDCTCVCVYNQSSHLFCDIYLHSITCPYIYNTRMVLLWLIKLLLFARKWQHTGLRSESILFNTTFFLLLSISQRHHRRERVLRLTIQLWFQCVFMQIFKIMSLYLIKSSATI